MTIQINILSLRATFNLSGNKPAIGAGSAEVVDAGHEDGRSRNHSTSTSHKTLVDEHDGVAPFETMNWLAGVGDICNGTSRDGIEDGSISHKHKVERNITLYRPKMSQTRATTKRLKHGGLQDTSNTRRSALRRHCEFWDNDQDGVIYPWDIFRGFRRLGFNFALCLWAAVTMAFCSSYSTQTSYLPHPFFAIYLDNISRNRHGSTTGAYDLDAELDTRRFDAIFEKYANGKNYLTLGTVYDVWSGQCCANDYFGWFAGGLECESRFIFVVDEHAATDSWQGLRCTSYFGQKMGACVKIISEVYTMGPYSGRSPKLVRRGGGACRAMESFRAIGN
jgi:hypothetical protein